eukprot:scaffold18987_cov109-Isochrysis_galbana.AAC.5
MPYAHWRGYSTSCSKLSYNFFLTSRATALQIAQNSLRGQSPRFKGTVKRRSCAIVATGIDARVRTVQPGASRPWASWPGLLRFLEPVDAQEPPLVHLVAKPLGQLPPDPRFEGGVLTEPRWLTFTLFQQRRNNGDRRKVLARGRVPRAGHRREAHVVDQAFAAAAGRPTVEDKERLAHRRRPIERKVQADGLERHADRTGGCPFLRRPVRSLSVVGRGVSRSRRVHTPARAVPARPTEQPPGLSRGAREHESVTRDLPASFQHDCVRPTRGRVSQPDSLRSRTQIDLTPRCPHASRHLLGGSAEAAGWERGGPIGEHAQHELEEHRRLPLQRRQKDAAEERPEEAVDERVGETPPLLEKDPSRHVGPREDVLKAGKLEADDGEDETQLVCR